MIKIATLSLALLVAFGNSLRAQDSSDPEALLLERQKKLSDYLEEIRVLPALDAQRFKPLDSLAREWVTRITGREFPKIQDTRIDPTLLFLNWRFDPENSKHLRLIELPRAAAAALIGYEISSASDQFVSFDSLAQNEKFQALAKEIAAKPDRAIGNLERDVLVLHRDWTRLGSIAGLSGGWHEGGDHLRGWLPVIPPPGEMEEGVEYAWLHPGLLPRTRVISPEKSQVLENAFKNWRDAFLASDGPAFGKASADLKAEIASLGYPSAYRGPEWMAREVRYNKSNAFRWAVWLYVLALFFALVAFLAKSRILWILPMAAAFAGLAYNVWGMWERTVLSERALIGNLYESMIYVGGVCAFGGIVFELIFRNRWFVASGALLAWLTLEIATSSTSFLDPAITPLAPILINNYWIHIHVPTIVASYAFLGLAVICAHFYIFGYMIFGDRSARMKEFAKFSFWLVPVGEIMLLAGIILGGIWADASWGRFWGWDPKEVWSLVTWLVFIVVIHGRWAGWLRDVGTAIGCIFGGAALLWTYYGANFIQSGRHSYAGASADASLPLWFWFFTASEVALLTAAAIAWAGRRNPSQLMTTSESP